MDIPTSNASFLAGEGDAACVSGDVSFQPDKEEFVVASTGPLAELGLQTNFVANPTAIKDPELREAMKAFLRVFFDTTDWITANPDEAVLKEKASDGGDYCRVQEEILGVLRFFIDTGSYQEGDDTLFLKEGHFDPSLINELYEESK